MARLIVEHPGLRQALGELADARRQWEGEGAGAEGIESDNPGGLVVPVTEE